MTLSVVLEAVMMICFGISWPASIIKTVQAKNPAGKSLLFLVLILSGYIAGLILRICDYNPSFWIYLVNALMVATDLTLTCYYKRKAALRNAKN